MEEKVLKTILENNLINEGDRVGVGLSGGSDSMALISCLLNLRERLKIELLPTLFKIIQNFWKDSISLLASQKSYKSHCN